MNKILIKQVLLTISAFFFSYIIMWLFLGWHILFFGEKAIGYIILIKYPILGVILSGYMACYALWKLEMDKLKERS